MTPTYVYGNSIVVRLYSPTNYIKLQKRESKKEKQARIAKELMFASWKTVDQNMYNIFRLKQICKPRHQTYLNKV